MDKEELEKFDKEQLDILLNDLQDIDKFTGFKNGAFKYELGKYQANLLINCIKKQKEVIDRIDKYIKENIYSYYDSKGEKCIEETVFERNANPKELLDILKEGKNE